MENEKMPAWLITEKKKLPYMNPITEFGSASNSGYIAGFQKCYDIMSSRMISQPMKDCPENIQVLVKTDNTFFQASIANGKVYTAKGVGPKEIKWYTGWLHLPDASAEEAVSDES